MRVFVRSARLLGACSLGMLLLPAVAQQSAPNAPQVASTKPGDKETAALFDQLGALAAGSTNDSVSVPTADAGPAGIVPLTKGFNASLMTSSQHDSADGWSSLLSPDVAYRFNSHFAVSFEVPAYMYINVVTTTEKKNPLGVVTKTTSSVEARHLLLGDSTFTLETDAHNSLFDYTLTSIAGLPTGDDADGLGAGQATYGFINHFERGIGDTFTPNIELGIDDNPNLTNSRIRKSYEVVGSSAHFQAGLDVALPWHLDFETDAYEELPIGTQTVTSTTTKGKKGKQVTTSTQESVGEDNGFTNSLDIPLNGHITLSGFYNRSLRNKIDTAGFSLTFLLRAPPKTKETK